MTNLIFYNTYTFSYISFHGKIFEFELFQVAEDHRSQVYSSQTHDIMTNFRVFKSSDP